MSASERELALWLAEGHTAERIAEWLGRSVRTIKAMIAVLLEKCPNLRTLRAPTGHRHRSYAASQFGREGLNIDAL
jgi:DNA-binding NarL/FixJ family response regulator